MSFICASTLPSSPSGASATFFIISSGGCSMSSSTGASGAATLKLTSPVGTGAAMSVEVKRPALSGTRRPEGSAIAASGIVTSSVSSSMRVVIRGASSGDMPGMGDITMSPASSVSESRSGVVAASAAPR